VRVPELGSLSFLYGPVLAFGLLGILVLLMRWVFSTSHRVPRAVPPAPGEPRDYGLLTSVATVESRDDADRLRGLLAGHSIRATVGDTPDGRAEVLVFAGAAGRARDLLAASG
jgi:hypothetical protein